MFSVAKNSFTINAWYYDNKCCCSEGSRCARVLGGRARSFFLNIRVPERKTTSNLTWKENILRPSKISKRLWSQNWFDTFYVLDCLRKRIACVHLVSRKIFFPESFSLLLRFCILFIPIQYRPLRSILKMSRKHSQDISRIKYIVCILQF